MKNEQRRRKKQKSPYVNIQWNKVATLFHETSDHAKEKGITISAADILRGLASAADKGLMFITHAGNPAIVEYVLEGTGPLNWRTRHIINRFEKQKYVTVKESPDGAVTVKITKDGFARALTYKLESMQLAQPKQWDKKWRVVMFDVPDTYKKLRDIFRMRLKQIGLYQLQKSVYIFPYPCFNEVEFLRELYGIAFTVQYLLVEKIEQDSLLREHFHLSF